MQMNPIYSILKGTARININRTTIRATRPINTVVGKRFCKRQQMRWSKTGCCKPARARWTTRCATRPQQWYPGMKSDGDQKMAA
jgi:hypothetical protein